MGYLNRELFSRVQGGENQTAPVESELKRSFRVKNLTVSRLPPRGVRNAHFQLDPAENLVCWWF